MIHDRFVPLDSEFSISGPNAAASAARADPERPAASASAVMTGETAFPANSSAGFGVEFLRPCGDSPSMDGMVKDCGGSFWPAVNPSESPISTSCGWTSRGIRINILLVWLVSDEGGRSCPLWKNQL
jgi:hypothetical protein